jgi:hypothetical protein
VSDLHAALCEALFGLDSETHQDITIMHGSPFDQSVTRVATAILATPALRAHVAQDERLVTFVKWLANDLERPGGTHEYPAGVHKNPGCIACHYLTMARDALDGEES